jgi:hypothetical protein
MKQLLLAVTALSLAGTIGTANAVPDNSITVDLWNAPTTPSNPSLISADPAQQALPSAIAALSSEGGASFFHLGSTAYSQPINYNLPAGGTNTIAAFFAADSPTAPPPSTCNATCQALTLSTNGYAHATLFEFTFATPGEDFAVMHDDGVSLFAAGTEDGCNQTSCPSDLLPLSASAPTNNVNSGPITIGAGTYDLWYTSANGLPEVLQTNTTNVVPAPLIGHGLFALLAVGGVLFGGRLLESLKKRHLHAA